MSESTRRLLPGDFSRCALLAELIAGILAVQVRGVDRNLLRWLMLAKKTGTSDG